MNIFTDIQPKDGRIHTYAQWNEDVEVECVFSLSESDFKKNIIKLEEIFKLIRELEDSLLEDAFREMEKDEITNFHIASSDIRYFEINQDFQAIFLYEIMYIGNVVICASSDGKYLSYDVGGMTKSF